MWTISVPKEITTLTTISLKHLNCYLIAVALKGGAIFLFKDRKHVDTIIASSTVGAMTFGPLGQEENVLVLVTVGK